MTGAHKRVTDRVTENTPQWIARADICRIDGARKPSAYVQRAYKYSQEHGGRPPGWARKSAQGQWFFDPAYIRAEAQENAATISVAEAARTLGASRRTIQNWVDAGIIATATDDRQTGTRRRIVRADFDAALPALKKRLKTAAAVGYREKRKERTSGSASGQEATEASGRESPGHRRELEEGLRHVQVQKEQAARAKAEAEEHLRRAVALEAEALTREAQLLARRGGGLPAADTDDASPPSDVVRQRAEAVAAQFEEAKRARQEETRQEEEATAIARRIADDMFDDRIGRADALLLFSRTALSRGVPEGIRKRVRKKFFGR